MSLRNFIINLFSILLILLSGTAYGQESIITKTGQEVLIYLDGTWIQKSKLNQALFEEQTATDADVFEVPDANKKGPTTSQVAEIESIIDILEEKEANIAVRLYKGSKKINQYKDRFHITSKNEKNRIMNLIKEQEIANAAINKDYIKLSDYIFSTKEIYKVKPSSATKKIGHLKATLEQEYGIVFGNKEEETVLSTEKTDKAVVQYPLTFTVKDTKGPRDPYKCDIAFDGKDPLTGRKKKETNSSLFFDFTQDKLKPYFKQDNFLTCESVITKVGKSYYVTLSFKLKSKDASNSYGSLKENDEMKIEFIDGDEIFGSNILNSNGEIEPYSGFTKFDGIYEFDREAIDKLSKKLIDNVGVFWSSGFEKYEIYNIDLLKNQLACLRKG